jgi:hypothetical protein
MGIKPNGNIIINLVGGLCNQMFQISAAYSLSLLYNKQLILKINSQNPHSSKNYFETIFRKLNPEIKMIIDTNYIYLLLFLEPSDGPLLHFDIPNHNNIELSGYFQNEKYFQHNRNLILSLFEAEPQREIKLKNKYLNIHYSYFIHIRRGDYLQNDLHNINLNKYYEKAIEYINKLNSNAIFYVFSDDIEYCNQIAYLKTPNINIINGLDEIDSLYLMSMCYQGGIGSNSSFSWWGGYLNENINKLVIYPNKWFNSYWDVDIGWKNSYIMDINNYTINKKL